MREFISKLLPHNNARCVAPPGVLRAMTGVPVMVPSVMRSGTHIVIDLILNNFNNYRHAPLYLDIDQYFSHGLPYVPLKKCGNTVIKTHYPWGKEDKRREEVLIWLANHGKIIRPTRSIEAIWASLQNFGDTISREVFEKEVAHHEDFWSRFDHLEVKFDEITDPNKTKYVLKSIAEFLGQPMPKHAILPYHRDQIKRVLYAKMLTRIFGKYAPRINTTIKFARTPKKVDSWTENLK